MRSSPDQQRALCDTIVKHGGGSVMVWECFAGEKVGDLVKIEGVMDQRQYYNILKFHAFPSGKKIASRGFLFSNRIMILNTHQNCAETILTTKKSKKS